MGRRGINRGGALGIIRKQSKFWIELIWDSAVLVKKIKILQMFLGKGG